MAKFCTLASSSSGNSVYISASGTSILVDAGVSCKKITTALASLEHSPSDISAVLITHEHIDHIKGLRLFLQKSNAAVCATEQVLERLIELDSIDTSTKMVIVGATPFCVGNLEITAFPTCHDSVGSVGFTITTAAEQKLCVATDLGHVTDEVLKAISKSSLAYIEANYNKRLLSMGGYPAFLKQRISSDYGHLENSQCAELAKSLLSGGTTRFVLGHLSKENNNPYLAHQTVLDGLCQSGAAVGSDFTLDVAPYDSMSGVIRF